MSALVDAQGNVLSKSQLTAKATTVTQPTVYKFTEDIYELFTHVGDSGTETRKRKKYYAGQEVKSDTIDALTAYQAGTVTSTSPATLATAGGTVLTINGTGFDGVTSVTVGGTAGTNLKKLSNKKLQVTTPAKTAGAQALVVVRAGGNITGTNVTYA